jgi:hypothetical protein
VCASWLCSELVEKSNDFCFGSRYTKLTEMYIFQRHAPDHTVFMISCLLILVCIPFRFTGRQYIEDVLLILSVPGSWFFLLFFARFVLSLYFLKKIIYELRHDKTNIMRLRPAWIQTSLRIHASDQYPCCSLTNPITSREIDSKQHGS